MHGENPRQRYVNVYDMGFDKDQITCKWMYQICDYNLWASNLLSSWIYSKLVVHIPKVNSLADIDFPIRLHKCDYSPPHLLSFEQPDQRKKNATVFNRQKKDKLLFVATPELFEKCVW